MEEKKTLKITSKHKDLEESLEYLGYSLGGEKAGYSAPGNQETFFPPFHDL